MRFLLCLLIVFCSSTCSAEIAKNVGSQYVWAVLIDEVSGEPINDPNNVTVLISKDGSTAAGGGTVSTVDGDIVQYAFTQAETNCDSLQVKLNHANAAYPVVVNQWPKEAITTPIDANVVRIGGLTTYVGGDTAGMLDVNLKQVDGSGDNVGGSTAGMLDVNTVEIEGDDTVASWMQARVTAGMTTQGYTTARGALLGELDQQVDPNGVFSAAALVNAPGADPNAIWRHDISGHSDTDTPGGLLTVRVDAAVSDIEGAEVIPVSQVPVPKSRTWDVVRNQNGLVGSEKKGLQVGEAQTFAINFYSDLPTNGRLNGFTSIAIKSGTSGGVTFDTDNKGVDKAKAKIKITGVTAGTYILDVVATYQDAFGGGTVEAEVTLVVTD